jgi:class 3 adenylate cyclase
LSGSGGPLKNLWYYKKIKSNFFTKNHMQKSLWNLEIEYSIIKRSTVFAVIVGTILIAINQSGAILHNKLDQTRIIQIILTLIVPFFVSLISSLLSVSKFKDILSINKDTIYSLESQVNIISRFPDQNPHPIFRLSLEGDLLYHNKASEPVLEALGINSLGIVPPGLKKNIKRILQEESGETLEINCQGRIYSLLLVYIKEYDFINIYGTDVTAMKLINKFPDQNPNPVFRLSLYGDLLYHNKASISIIETLEINVGDKVPEGFKIEVDKALDSGEIIEIKAKSENRIYSLLPVFIYEYGFINIYGTDITAVKLINKFPDQNPHPVFRISKDDVLIYANQASNQVIRKIGIKPGDKIPESFRLDMERVLDTKETLEIEAEGKFYSLLVVSIYEFGFINIYGTDVSANKELEKAHIELGNINEENEKLLLNILPNSIATRLKKGEKVIADKFSEISILFTDVVGFTELSNNLTPSELVDLLNTIFTIFDRLTEKYNLEKIKTIGDSYMVVGGLNDNPYQHLEDIAGMALDIHKEIEQFNSTGNFFLNVRTGIHIGPAVAGVIGIKKFIYDVWGDTVNTASRMESHGIPGKIQSTEPVYEILKHKFLFEQRGIIEVKGKEPLMTYFLENRR